MQQSCPKSLRASERSTTSASDFPVCCLIRVIGYVGNPHGFSVTKDDELYQLYVSRGARGTGAAQKLIAEAEQRLADKGYEVAWLACAIGNDRAARFYEKSGWHFAHNFLSELVIPDGTFQLEV